VAKEAAGLIQVTETSMRIARALSVLMLAFCPALIAGQPPAVPGTQPPRPGARGGGGRGRGGVQVMTLSTTAFPDGGLIPPKYTQAGEEVSPPLSWSDTPEGVVSFVLVVHDVDALIGAGTDDVLHWMLWNVPAAVTSIHERAPSMAQLPDGTRQISATGPYYRGPGAAAAGPIHHYVFDLYALDTLIEVPALGASPTQTRASVMAAMAGHIRGKASYLGLFKRP
jgi:Raf kinase inhibitor-like YbhB/YbcL family protein